MSEVLWSPKESRNWDDFTQRLEQQFKRYEAAGCYYSKSAFLISFASEIDSRSRQYSVSLSKELNLGEIRYTIDGNEPTHSSTLYEQPFAINSTSTIKAATFLEGELVSKSTQQQFLFHKAIFQPVKLLYPFEKYGNAATLNDGLRGSISFRDGKWQGYHQYDFDAVIDLGEVKSISKITTGFLQNTVSWIFFPTTVEFAISPDSVNYQTVGATEIPIASGHLETSIRNIEKEFPMTEARYVRVRAKNVGVCPEWHVGKGDKAWLFVDEIIVE
jgi:hexosaminidase